MIKHVRNSYDLAIDLKQPKRGESSDSSSDSSHQTSKNPYYDNVDQVTNQRTSKRKHKIGPKKDDYTNRQRQAPLSLEDFDSSHEIHAPPPLPSPPIP